MIQYHHHQIRNQFYENNSNVKRKENELLTYSSKNLPKSTGDKSDSIKISEKFSNSPRIFRR
jgi:hypothetical protein